MPCAGNLLGIYRKMQKCCHPSESDHIQGVQMAYKHVSESKMTLGTVQSLFYNMAGAKRNGATAFLSSYKSGSTHFIKQI